MEWILGLLALWIISVLTGNESSGNIKNLPKRDDEASKRTDLLRKIEQDRQHRLERERKFKELQAAIKTTKDKKLTLENTDIVKNIIEKALNEHRSKERKEEQRTQLEDVHVHIASKKSAVKEQPRPPEKFSIDTILGKVRGPIPNILEVANPAAFHFQAYGINSFWHITHRHNIPTILEKGILSNKTAHGDLSPIDISNSDVQKRRGRIEPFYNRAVHEYAPLYINAKNPMLYVRKDIQHELCIIEISLSVLKESNFVFTDGNAASQDTKFYKEPSELSALPWDVMKASYWTDFPDGKRKRCAEVLIYPKIGPEHILRVHCCSGETFRTISSYPCNSAISPHLFF